MMSRCAPISSPTWDTRVELSTGGVRIGRHQIQVQADIPKAQSQFGTTSEYRKRSIYVTVRDVRNRYLPALTSYSYLIKDDICFLCICAQSFPLVVPVHDVLLISAPLSRPVSSALLHNTSPDISLCDDSHLAPSPSLQHCMS